MCFDCRWGEYHTSSFSSDIPFSHYIPQRAVEEQQFNLREGAEIIIATPGRLKDVIDRHVLVLSQCSYIVLDEADRMVHLGFEADLTYILDALPTELLAGEESMDIDGNTNLKARTRVTTLFSATMPPAVERLTRKYLKKAATITIGEAGRAVDTVEQRVEFVIGEEKKKCVLDSIFQYTLTVLAGNDYWTSSTTVDFQLRLSCLSTKRKRQIWWRRIYNVLVYVPIFSSWQRLLLTL